MATTTLDLTRTSVRILQSDGSGKSLKIRKFVAEPLGAGQEISEPLRKAVAQLRADRGTVILTIPREQVITRFLKFPATRHDELAQMVELSGKAQLPYPRDQAVADFRVIDQQAGSSTIQLVACHRDLVEQHVRMAREAGLEPAWIVPSSWGLFGWYQQIVKAPGISEPAMVVNVDIDHTDLALIRDGRLLFSRSLGQGLGDWQAGPEALGIMAQEIERSLSSLRKELPGTEAASLVLTGIGPLEPWRSVFEQRLGKPVIVRQMRIKELAAAPDASPVVAIGLAMAEPGMLLNLMPSEARAAQAQRRHVQQASWAGVLAVVAMLLGAMLVTAYARRQQRETGSVVSTLKQLEVMTRRTERQLRDVQLIEGLLRSRRALADMLVQVFRLTPEDILLESLTYERPKRELVVRGSAPTMRQVLDYLRSFEESGRFAGVELRYSARRNTKDASRQEFELVARVPAAS